MDIRDAEASLAGIAHVLRPGAWFVTSLLHPCFPGNTKRHGSGYGRQRRSHHWTTWAGRAAAAS